MRELVEAFNRRDLAPTVAALDEFVVWDARRLQVPELQTVYQGMAGVAEFWPGSGNPIEWRQCHLITVVDGKATAHRAIRDDLGLMRQMGAIPGGSGRRTGQHTVTHQRRSAGRRRRRSRAGRRTGR